MRNRNIILGVLVIFLFAGCYRTVSEEDTMMITLKEEVKGDVDLDPNSGESMISKIDNEMWQKICSIEWSNLDVGCGSGLYFFEKHNKPYCAYMMYGSGMPVILVDISEISFIDKKTMEITVENFLNENDEREEVTVELIYEAGEIVMGEYIYRDVFDFSVAEYRAYYVDNIIASTINEMEIDFNDTYKYGFDEPIIKRDCEGYLSIVKKFDEVSRKINGFIEKYTVDGELIWTKALTHNPLQGARSHLEVLENGCFLVGIEKWYGEDDLEGLGYAFNSNIEYAYLIMYDQEGEMLWEKAFKDEVNEQFSKILITENNEILVVGNVQGQENQKSDIGITKLDIDGNVINQVKLGGTGIELLCDAKYNKELGLVIKGRSRSIDGSFYGEDLKDYNDSVRGYRFIARLDSAFNVLWKYNIKEYTNLLESEGFGDFCVIDDCVVLSEVIKENNRMVLVCVSPDGKKLWKKEYEVDGIVDTVMTQLAKGEFALALGKYMEGEGEGAHLVTHEDGKMYFKVKEDRTGELMVFNQEGIITYQNDDIGYAPDKIIPTNDGGFMMKATMIVGEELFWVASSRLEPADTKMHVEKYNKDGHSVWDKDYDKVYKMPFRIDYCKMFGDDTIIIVL